MQNLRAINILVVAAALGFPLQGEKPPAEPATPSVAFGRPSPCFLPEANAEHLLERQIKPLSATSANVGVVIVELSTGANVPLSFIQASPEAQVTLDIRSGTVRDALDQIVARAPSYRYGIVSDRIVVYPRDPRWKLPLTGLHLRPGKRVGVARALADEIKHRLPQFSDLHGPWILGNVLAYTYQDIVAVEGDGSVLEIMLQLLGSRPAAFLLVVGSGHGGRGLSLSVNSNAQLKAIRLEAPRTTLGGVDETVQLTAIGTMKYRGRERDLTREVCGTVYTVSDERVLKVTADGLVTAVGSGEAEVTAANEWETASLTLKVHAP